MDRRGFLKTGIALGTAAGTAPWLTASETQKRPQPHGGHNEWHLAELVQVPVVPEVASTFLPMGLIRLSDGTWGCHAVEGNKDPNDQQIRGWLWTQASELPGPWERVSRIWFDDLKIQATAVSSALRTTTLLRSGRIMIPLDLLKSDVRRWDTCVIYSDDQGKTWRHSTPLRQQIQAPSGLWAGYASIAELDDGTLLWPIDYLEADAPVDQFSYGASSQAYVVSKDGGETWKGLTFTFPNQGALHFREAGVRVLADGEWFAWARVEDRGLPHLHKHHGPYAMPQYVTSHSSDGLHWSEPHLFVNGVEMAAEVLPGGALMAAWRDNNYAGLRLSYDGGRSWGPQYDPFETPWKRRARIVHGQWPPGGAPRIQVLDENTAVAAYETGIAPTGTVIDPPSEDSEIQGWIAVRYVRRA